ncbi:MAG: PAS domain-containing protein [Candidatus Marinimicrobia bacterium]|nr:PAS domain-containing protein [Candidatus Neomarinimicrobiota bacterium]
MKQQRLIYRLLPTYLAIAFIVIIILLWYSLRGISDFNTRQTARDLLARADLVRQALDYHPDLDNADFEKISYEMGSVSRTRVTILDPQGLVLGDSDKDSDQMENHFDRPEFKNALFGEVGQSIRFSQTLQRDMMYLALPLISNGKVKYIIRTSIPLQSLADSVEPIQTRLILVAFLAAFLAILISVVVAKLISRPIINLQTGAERIAAGDFAISFPRSSVMELDSLANSMNRMAAELDRRIRMITRQRNEQRAVLASMIEGLIAVDLEERIIRMNRSAGKLLNCKPKKVTGKSLVEVVRNPSLQNFIRELLTTKSRAETEITLIGIEEQHLRVSGAPLLDQADSCRGVVVVLNDITQLKRLEHIRQEFVGNVAHELKTPLTSIKGFVETMQSGALEKPEDARRFIDIIASQADRLDTILEDLLHLSKIEQQRDRHEIVLEPARLIDIIDGAIRDCESLANQRSITIKVNTDPEIMIATDRLLLRQAITNLIDNAVKYSNHSTEVIVSAKKSRKHIDIVVSDQGIGIAEQHKPHLFERFYRVDKGRSRKAGGTGLGLAIVKHIVLAHNGSISVASQLNKGSVFTIRLPIVK